jgi:hypothetical protein
MFQNLSNLSFLLSLQYKVFHNKNLHNHNIHSWLHPRIFFRIFYNFKNAVLKKFKKKAPWCLGAKAIFCALGSFYHDVLSDIYSRTLFILPPFRVAVVARAWVFISPAADMWTCPYTFLHAIRFLLKPASRSFCDYIYIQPIDKFSDLLIHFTNCMT